MRHLHGSPAKINLIKTSNFTFDPNLLVKMISDKFKGQALSVDQLHEAVKSLGVTNYQSEDMDELIDLLKSSGITIQ